jgi:5-methylcytosine-specific restriction protein B
MARYYDARRTYEGTARFVDAALRRDDSLFTPGRAIWTKHLLDELDERFIQRPDMRADVGFEAKLRDQLAGASPAAVQLMGEVMYLYYLPARWNVGGAAKRSRIGEVLSWSPATVSMPGDLDAILDDGVGSGGSSFSTRKPAILAQLIRYVRAWKALDQASRDGALDDPWAFKAFIGGIPVEEGAYFAREALLHMVHPDTFERIFSRSEKRRLVDALKDFAPAEGDNDRRIWELRQLVGARIGTDFDWYETIPARALWRPFDDPWTGYIFWAGRFKALSVFDKEERDYKLVIAEHMSAARAAVLAGADDWVAKLKRAYGSPNNITSYFAHGSFLRWVEANPDVARGLLAELWDGSGEPLDRFETFINAVPREAVAGRGGRTNVLALLLLAIDAYGLPPFKVTALQRSYGLVKFDAGPGDPEIDLYRRSLRFYDKVLERGKTDGLELRDRLDAQGVMYCIADWDVGPEWPPEERVAFERWRGAQPATTADEEDQEDEDIEEEPVGPTAVPAVDDQVPVDPLPPLAARLLLDEGYLREIADLLDHRRQVIFYGPPGTGKTYVARELAWALSGDKARVRLVQFHPSYAYEDFIEGYRPKAGGDPGFELRNGPFKALAQAALADRSHDYYLVIDEMNRGNVAKVLGELYFLLEYRDEKIQLQYSAEPFELPPNLRIIGTMNTADRSIALLDAALRRRFAFIPFFPDRPPVEGLLRRWLRKNRPEMAWVADVVDRANERLADRNGAIGPSFFLKSDLDEGRLEGIWRHEIGPYLEDHFLDDPERLREFELPALRGRPSAVPADVSPGADATATVAGDAPSTADEDDVAPS